MAATLAEVNAHAEALVAVVFDGLHFVLAHRDVLAEALRDFRLASAGARLFGLVQNVLGNLLERVESISKAGILHGDLNW